MDNRERDSLVDAAEAISLSVRIYGKGSKETELAIKHLYNYLDRYEKDCEYCRQPFNKVYDV